MFPPQLTNIIHMQFVEVHMMSELACFFKDILSVLISVLIWQENMVLRMCISLEVIVISLSLSLPLSLSHIHILHKPASCKEYFIIYG